MRRAAAQWRRIFGSSVVAFGIFRYLNVFWMGGKGKEGGKWLAVSGWRLAVGESEDPRARGREDTRAGGLEGTRDGGPEDTGAGGCEGWRTGGPEGKRTGGLEGRRTRGLEGQRTRGLGAEDMFPLPGKWVR